MQYFTGLYNFLRYKEETHKERTLPSDYTPIMLKRFCLFICLMTKFKSLQSQELITITETTLCYNSSLKGQYPVYCIYSTGYIIENEVHILCLIHSVILVL